MCLHYNTLMHYNPKTNEQKKEKLVKVAHAYSLSTREVETGEALQVLGSRPGKRPYLKKGGWLLRSIT